MRRAAGQAVREAGGLVHALLRLALVLALVAALALAALAARLSQGPLALPWLIPWVEQAMPAPYRLTIGSLALAWDGLGERLDRPLELQLAGIALTDASGAAVLRAPRVAISLAIRPLLAGAIRPRAIEIDGLRLTGWRNPDGSAGLDLAGGGAAGGAGVVEAMLAELARPPAGGWGDGAGGFLGALRRVRLRDVAIAITDRSLDTVWHMTAGRLDVQRADRGGFAAHARLALALGAGTVPLSAGAELAPGGQDIGFTLTLPPLVPAALARAAPALSPLAAVDAPLTLSLSGRIDTALHRPRLALAATLGAGRVRLARGFLPLGGARLAAEGTLDEFDLRILALDLAPPGGAASHATGWLHARRDARGYHALASLALDGLAFADLPALWPEGLGGPGGRRWLTANIPEGRLSDVSLGLALDLAADFSSARITYIDGRAQGHGLVVHWLRPVPPLTDGEARVSITDPDAIRIAVLSARQAPEHPSPATPPLTVTGGEVVLSGLAGADQFANISARFTGRLSSLLAVLGHQRLHLLDRQPIRLGDPRGEVTGQIAITALPLVNSLDMDDVHIAASGRLSGVHLGGIAGGHDLDHGALELAASNDGLSLAGTAELAGIPARLKLAMDFRAGPPAQIVRSVTVAARPSIAQLSRLGLDTAGMLGGAVGLDAVMTSRRDGAETVALTADLAPATISLTRLNWEKPAERQAKASARLQLRAGRITALEAILASGPGLDLRGDLAFAGGHPRLLRLTRLALGPPGGRPATDLAGSLTWPARPGEPWVVALDGASLDASAEFASTPEPKGKPKPKAETGPPWRATVRLGRVLTGEGALSDLSLSAASDGRIMTRLDASGATPGGRFRLAITPERGGRRLAASAADAGGLARALGLASDLHGGTLTLDGRYDDTAASHPLTGTARIVDFRLKDAPFAARLLQALSVYGIVAAIGSPDLAIAEFIARFRLADDVLSLTQARAYNASLGITGKGRLDLARHAADVQGTIVPAYLLNSLLGRLPLIGKLLSPETGGGLIAMNYALRGPFADPSVTVNPLSAVTPGFLRGVFDIFDGSAAAPPAQPPGGIPSGG